MRLARFNIFEGEPADEPLLIVRQRGDARIVQQDRALLNSRSSQVDYCVSRC